jgi:catechol 2,3-dioxygenase-like lactoylglutathione lyase family enzyme
MQVRVARQTGRLDAVVAFYRDGLGLPEIGRFVDHDGYSGVMLDLPGTGAHLEFTATEHVVPPTPHVEDLLVLYVGSRAEVDRLVERSGARVVASANPYWDGVGVTVIDPDGFRVVLVAASWPMPADGAV